MTTATTEGRRLRLAVEGIPEPFLVDPLPAKRGRFLTDEFIAAATMQRTVAQSEQIFIEAIGPANYSRIAGQYVHEFHEGEYFATWAPDGLVELPADYPRPVAPEGLRYLASETDDFEGEAIRQEEAEALCLCAFYWQTVVGMEAVREFVDSGEGTAGSLKALGLLQTRLGLSTSASSRSRGMESLISGAGSEETPVTATSFGSVRLPADYRPPLNRLRGRRRK